MSDSGNKEEPYTDMIMEPVCMAQTHDLIREIKRRYATGAFILYHPMPQTEEQLKIWVEENQQHGFTVWPERYHRQDNSWGHRHLLLGLLSRLTMTIHDSIRDEERDIPKSEQF